MGVSNTIGNLALFFSRRYYALSTPIFLKLQDLYKEKFVALQMITLSNSSSSMGENSNLGMVSLQLQDKFLNPWLKNPALFPASQ